MIKISQIGTYITCLFFCLAWQVSPAHADQYKIALIHSYEEGYIDAKRTLEILKDELRANGLKCDIREYFLHCEEYEEAPENERMSLFIDDLSSWGADLVAVLDDQATYALMACNNPRIRRVPVVFGGVNFPNEGLLKQYPNVTGHVDFPDYCRTSHMIERIMGPSRICLLNGMTYLDRKIWEALNEQCEGKIDISSQGLSNHVKRHAANKEELNILPTGEKYENETINKTRIIRMESDLMAIRDLMWVGRGSHTTFLLTKRDYTTRNAAALFSNPSFATINEGFGVQDNLLGGYFAPLETQLKDMATAIKERLRGQMPNQQVSSYDKQYVLNWHMLEKYEIPTSSIPQEYIIMYIPFTERYHYFILYGSILLGIIVLAIIILLSISYLRERKRKREALHNLQYEHETLCLAIEGGATYVWRLEEDAIICDSQFLELIHHPNDRIALAELLTFIHPEDRDRFQRNYAQIRNHPQYKGQYRCSFSGEYQWWEIRYNTINTAGHAPLITCLLQNIQEVKDREEELIQARKLAERAELKQSFLNNMSHEIRTPLNAIVGFSNMLTSDPDLSEEEKQEFNTIINTNTDLLLKLVNDVLELSRIESGSLSFHIKEESVRDMLESFYQTYHFQVHPPLEFIKDFPDEDITLHIDAMRLQQVITNFLNNANKFTSSGYLKLGYYCRTEENHVYIYVEDTGKGIPATELEMVFERFYKRDEFAQGVGLGLSICRSIVERMNGRIEVSSEEGKGSRFTVVLPIQLTDN